MDATPLSTSIIILYSEAGCTFGNEMNKSYSKMRCQKLREKLEWLGIRMKLE